MIRETGGLYTGQDNLANSGSLDYILDAIQSLYFGVDRYPTIIDKAAVIGYNIITNHVFYDGNKRTGLMASVVMLELNGYELDLSDMKEAELFILKTANSETTLEDFTDWITQKSVKIA